MSQGSWLVTGGGGFLGANLIPMLLEVGEEVVVVLRPESRRWRLEGLDVQIIECRLNADEMFEALPRDISVVAHLASSGVAAPLDSREAVANVVAAVEVVEWAARTSRPRVLNAGTPFEYGAGRLLRESHSMRPLGLYGASKASARTLAQEVAYGYSVPFTTLIPFNVFGPYEAPGKLLPRAILDSLRGAPVLLSEGSQRRDWVYVRDVVEAFYRVGLADVELPSLLNVCSGNPLSVRELLSMLALSLPASDFRYGALAARRGDESELSGSPDLLRRLLDWAPETPTIKGLEMTVEWFLTHAQKMREYEL